MRGARLDVQVSCNNGSIRCEVRVSELVVRYSKLVKAAGHHSSGEEVWHVACSLC